jgi:hypothetical protein
MNKSRVIPENNEIRVEMVTKYSYVCVISPRDKLTRKIETMSPGLFKYILDKVLTGQPE